jgi:hypothetical protein
MGKQVTMRYIGRESYMATLVNKMSDQREKRMANVESCCSVRHRVIAKSMELYTMNVQSNISARSVEAKKKKTTQTGKVPISEIRRIMKRLSPLFRVFGSRRCKNGFRNSTTFFLRNMEALATA